MHALSIASSGLAAASAALEASAVNVANLDTNATALRASAEDLLGGGVRVTISPEARSLAYGGAGGVDLVREVPAQIAAVSAYRANLKTIEAVDEAFNTLLEVGWG